MGVEALLDIPGVGDEFAIFGKYGFQCHDQRLYLLQQLQEDSEQGDTTAPVS